MAMRFECAPKSSILRAAKNAGLELSAGCAQRRGYTCRARLLAGVATNVRSLSCYATVDPGDLVDGRILLCSATPIEDVLVKPDGRWAGQVPTRSSRRLVRNLD